MNWKPIVQLSLLGLAMGVVSVVNSIWITASHTTRCSINTSRGIQRTPQ
jgi:hypothetical protein